MTRVVVVLCLLVGAEAHAQIVNVQGQLAKAPKDNGFASQFELKLDWRTGNSSELDIAGSAAVMMRRGRVLALALVRGEYGESRDFTFTQKTFEHLRARIAIDCVWRWEVFGQHEYDEFKRLAVRMVAGSGPALQILDTKKLAIISGAAYMLEYERLDDKEMTVDAGDRYVNHRASFYVSAIQRADETISVIETFYVQPRIDEPGDIRLLGEIALTSKLRKHVAITNGFSIAYDRTPPDGVEKLDTQLKLGLLLSF